jgi:phosphoserine phosphatase
VSDAARLPSWRPGKARNAIVRFLGDAESVPRDERVACFDNDGTLCCEQPTYIQYEFFVDALRRRLASDASLRTRAEFAAVLGNDPAEIAAIGLERIALALAGLFEGLAPEAFAAEVRDFMTTATHRRLGRPMREVVYQPMLELLDELRALDFTIAIVTGGGTEFVRAISNALYGTPAELVVGTLIAYDFTRAPDGIQLRRTARVLGDANEGAAKVTNIQTQLGRRPIIAAGNSAGDQEMLAWATNTTRANLALVIDHDDAEREYAYESRSATLGETEAITAVAKRNGWTAVSMADDWSTVFR